MLILMIIIILNNLMNLFQTWAYDAAAAAADAPAEQPEETFSNSISIFDHAHWKQSSFK